MEGKKKKGGEILKCLNLKNLKNTLSFFFFTDKTLL